VGQAVGHKIFWYSRYKANIPGVVSFGLPINIATLPWVFHFFEPSYLMNAIKQVQPDLVHVHFASTGLLALPLSRFSPLVVTTMGSDISPMVGYRGLYAPFTKLLLENADCITVKSTYMGRELQKIGDFSHKTEHINWGVELDLFRPDRDTDTIRRKLRIPDGTLIFLAPRKMTPLYNHHITLEAFRYFRNANHLNAVLIFVGFNPDQRYLLDLRRKARVWDIEKAIRFLPAQDYDEMADLYALADVMISIPQSEGFPHSIYEAWASGLYMILSDLPHYRQELSDGQTARLVPLGDAHALADALAWVSDHPEARNTARKVGRELAKSNADKTEQSVKMNRIYTRLLISNVS
jgi:glycosyltransferase involved in cell wall biosynthesis